MPYNVPTFTTSNFSFGPGILFMGASGATPTVDVGGITEDGVKFTVKAQKKHIVQGNPKEIVYSFIQADGLDVELTGIEWNLNKLPYAIGAGNTTSGAGDDTFTFGGAAIATTVALQIRHEMATSGHTLDAYVWKVVPGDEIPLSLDHDEHKFPHKFTAQRSSTDWAGTTLAKTAQLFKIVRTK